jgi:hypothetical protein
MVTPGQGIERQMVTILGAGVGRREFLTIPLPLLGRADEVIE